MQNTYRQEHRNKKFNAALTLHHRWLFLFYCGEVTTEGGGLRERERESEGGGGQISRQTDRQTDRQKETSI